MKKLVIVLMGVCTIVACSDEAFQGMGEENESPEIPVSANSFNNDDSGHAHGDNPLSGIIWAGKNYASPWIFGLREILMGRVIYNHLIW